VKFEGFAHKYGDNLNTDVIIPGPYMATCDRAIMAAHAMEGIDPDFTTRVRQGDIVVGGKNFGCGSTRPAARTLSDAGVSCIIAKSFARLFLRNAINLGVPAMECAEAADGISTGDRVEVDAVEGMIRNLTTGATFTIRPMAPFLQEIILLGGLVNYAREKLKNPQGGTA
jgi:3-isopropylmalate/(R)-2-methylmalate dehydratase small subunit